MILVSVNEIRVERNATLTLFPLLWYGACPKVETNPPCEEYLANNFTLPPEVCLSSRDDRYRGFQLLKMPACNGPDGQTPLSRYLWRNKLHGVCYGPPYQTTQDRFMVE
jgi:hypothetical protein